MANTPACTTKPQRGPCFSFGSLAAADSLFQPPPCPYQVSLQQEKMRNIIYTVRSGLIFITAYKFTISNSRPLWPWPDTVVDQL